MQAWPVCKVYHLKLILICLDGLNSKLQSTFEIKRSRKSKEQLRTKQRNTKYDKRQNSAYNRQNNKFKRNAKQDRKQNVYSRKPINVKGNLN